MVTPDLGGGPRVSIYSVLGTGLVRRSNYFTLDPGFGGGVRTAVGDINRDGIADLVVIAGVGGGPRVVLLDGRRVLTTDGFNPADRLGPDFFVFDSTVRYGAFVAVGDIDGDGFNDLAFTAGPGGPRVQVLNGRTLLDSGSAAALAAPLASFFVRGDSDSRSGASVAVTDADGDDKADLVVGSGEGQPSRVRVYLGKNFGVGEPADAQDLDPFPGAVLVDGVFVG